MLLTTSKTSKIKVCLFISIALDANMYQIDDWKEEHPEWEDTSSVESRVLDKLYMTSMGGTSSDEDERNMKKVIRNVLQEVVVNKEKN